MTFSIKKSFKESWALFFSKKLYWRIVAASFLAIAGLYLAFGLSSLAGLMFLSQGKILLFALVILVAVFFALYFLLVNISIPLDVYKTKNISVRKVFKKGWNPKRILQLVVLFVILAVVVGAIGFLLFIVGSKLNGLLGIVLMGVWAGYFAIRWAFALYVFVDMNLGPIDSLKKSHKIMKKNGWKFLGFVVIVSILSILAQAVISGFAFISPMLSQVLTLGFGILIAPWFSLLSVSPYVQLTHHNN